MAKGPIVTAAVKVRIAKVYQKHPKWKAPEVRNEVSCILRIDNPTLPKEFPSLSTVQKVLATLRQPFPPNPLDKPWHFGLLRDYPHLSAEAVRHILEAQEAIRSSFKEVAKATADSEKPVRPEDYHLTVRQALWVARLYDIIRKHVETDEPRERYKNVAPDDPDILFTVAANYADYELLCDLAGIPCDTSELDLALSHSLQEFYDFIHRQNAQSLREKHFVLDPEGHRQPHKTDSETGYFVFDPDCPACKDQEFNGNSHNLRMELTRKGVFEKQKDKLSKNTGKGRAKGGTK